MKQETLEEAAKNFIENEMKFSFNSLETKTQANSMFKNGIMKKYYMYNFAETKELYIGEFQSDGEFWKYYWDNEIKIIEKQSKLDRDSKIWHIDSF
jgi:hypothetical protein